MSSTYQYDRYGKDRFKEESVKKGALLAVSKGPQRRDAHVRLALLTTRASVT
jgi:hypothetical protein